MLGCFVGMLGYIGTSMWGGGRFSDFIFIVVWKFIFMGFR